MSSSEEEHEELTDLESDLIDRLDTAIQTGTDEESIREIDALLAEGANLNSRHLSPLCHASMRSTTVVLDHLLARGATIEDDTLMKQSPLHFAAAEGNIDAVRCLLRHATAADLHRFNHGFGWTALGQAVVTGHETIARLLLQAGTRADCCDHERAVNTPLRYAVDDGRSDLVKLLLEFRANPDQRGWMARTPRDSAWALKNKYPEIFAMIDRIPRTESPV